MISGLAALITVTSVLIRGFSGFGSALVNAPLFALLFGPTAAVPMSATFEFAATAQLLPGAYILVTVDEEIMLRIIAVIVLVLTFAVMRGWRFKGRPRDVTPLGVGAITGSMLRSVGIGGTVPGLYLLAAAPTVVVARATMIRFVTLFA